MLWALGSPRRLSPTARDAIESPSSEVFASAVSVWEIAIKTATGKLRAPDDLILRANDADFRPLAIEWQHGTAAGALPRHHRDPFDRMLVAQAQLEGLTLVTSDPKIGRYAVAVLPAS
jgi:PIN domain nuclease of toxin-antitoxin system